MASKLDIKETLTRLLTFRYLWIINVSVLKAFPSKNSNSYEFSKDIKFRSFDNYSVSFLLVIMFCRILRQIFAMDINFATKICNLLIIFSKVLYFMFVLFIIWGQCRPWFMKNSNFIQWYCRDASKKKWAWFVSFEYSSMFFRSSTCFQIVYKTRFRVLIYSTSS